MKKNLPIVFLFSLMITASITKAQKIVQLSFYSPLISTFDMQYTKDHLIISQDGLLIFDVSQPTKRPLQVSKTAYPGRTANSVAVQGNYAYLSQGSNGIFAVL